MAGCLVSQSSCMHHSIIPIMKLNVFSTFSCLLSCVLISATTNKHDQTKIKGLIKIAEEEHWSHLTSPTRLTYDEMYMQRVMENKKFAFFHATLATNNDENVLVNYFDLKGRIDLYNKGLPRFFYSTYQAKYKDALTRCFLKSILDKLFLLQSFDDEGKLDGDTGYEFIEILKKIAETGQKILDEDLENYSSKSKEDFLDKVQQLGMELQQFQPRFVHKVKEEEGKKEKNETQEQGQEREEKSTNSATATDSPTDTTSTLPPNPFEEQEEKLTYVPIATDSTIGSSESDSLPFPPSSSFTNTPTFVENKEDEILNSSTPMTISTEPTSSTSFSDTNSSSSPTNNVIAAAFPKGTKRASSRAVIIIDETPRTSTLTNSTPQEITDRPPTGDLSSLVTPTFSPPCNSNRKEKGSMWNVGMLLIIIGLLIFIIVGLVIAKRERPAVSLFPEV